MRAIHHSKNDGGCLFYRSALQVQIHVAEKKKQQAKPMDLNFNLLGVLWLFFNKKKHSFLNDFRPQCVLVKCTCAIVLS